jgi:nucleotide-binding universal stress UspA family protein
MLRKLLVHLDGSPLDRLRLDHAAALADRFGAHVSGLLLHEQPEILGMGDPSGSAFLRELMARSEAELEAAAKRLAPDFAGERRQFEAIDVGFEKLADRLTEAARLADLFVSDCPRGGAGLTPRAQEAVLFGSGRGCLLVPPGSQPGPDMPTIAIAWKSTPEAARAVTAALPLLEHCAKVVVLLVEEPGRTLTEDAGTGLLTYLALHGIPGSCKIVRGARDPGPALREACGQMQADLLVMGGYGHSRLRELVLGGTTRDVLAATTIPVLMAH